MVSVSRPETKPLRRFEEVEVAFKEDAIWDDAVLIMIYLLTEKHRFQKTYLLYISYSNYKIFSKKIKDHKILCNEVIYFDDIYCNML